MPAKPFFLQQDNIYAVPITHYTMEMAIEARKAFDAIQPDCVAVEFAETMTLQLLHAASRLPDLSLVMADGNYYMCEPCDPGFEALRSALEADKDAFCIDLDVESYPDIRDVLPDTYAVTRIGLEKYYNLCKRFPKTRLDEERETYMGKRLKELSLRYDKVLFVGGLMHVENVLKKSTRSSFPEQLHTQRNTIELVTLTESSSREVMAECGFFSSRYNNWREDPKQAPPDRQKLIYNLFAKAAEKYIKSTGNSFPGYHMRNLMKFLRNYSFIYNKLMPDLFQVITAAKGCVDPNFAYEVWALATAYEPLKNVDNLPELDLTAEEVWGKSKIVRFELKQKSRKALPFRQRRKDRSDIKFQPPGPFSICSYPPEDIIVENFGEFLQKKGTQLFTEEGARTVPFSTSLEDGIDTKETIRHWAEKKLYVKVKGKPPGGVGSVVVIFDEDEKESFPWHTTWLGEHEQESDMAFYATPTSKNVIGPGISRCEYGGFLMSYPPRRMLDVWSDPDYEECRSKSEVLLMAAIDYAVKPLIVYVASKPPRSFLKSFAKRFGKKIIYLPIGQLSPVTINKIRAFHVLDGHDKRGIAGEYIY